MLQGFTRHFSNPRRWPQVPRRPTKKNILVMRLGGIGEILVISPALRAVRERYPDAHITLLGEHPAVDVIRGFDLVDEILVANAVYRAHGLLWMLSPRFYSEILRVTGKLTSRKYDLFLDFQHLFYPRTVLKPLLVGMLSRAPRRIGFDSYGRGFFLTDRIRDDRLEEKHLLYRNRDFLRPLGIEPDEKIEMRVSGEDEAEADRLAKKWGLTNGEFVIGVNPGSSRPATQWSESRFVEVLQRIAADRAARVVLVGSKDDVPLCDRISRQVPGCVNGAGKTSIGVLAAILNRFDLFLSNDTGPLHIARRQGVPTVGLFRPGEFPIWGSYRDKTFAGIRRAVPCAPCYLYRCSHHTCMKLIETKDVLEAVDRVLSHENTART